MKGFGFVLGVVLAGVGFCAAWGQEVEAAGASGLEKVASKAAVEGVGLLPGIAREAIGDEALRWGVVEAVLRVGDPGVVFGEDVGSEGRDVWECGMVLTGTDGLPKVAWVAPESAADGAGIKAGDRIAEVGGAAVAEGANLSGVRAALGGGAEASVSVKVWPVDGGEAREVVLERAKREDVPGLAGAERLPTGIGYLRVGWMKGGVAADVSKALAGWEAENRIPAGVVLDLRGAGGSADAQREIVGIAARFALPGKILFRVDEGTDTSVTIAVGALPGDRVRKPLMVLVDEGTTGAAELLAIALGGGGEGVLVVGRETSGNPLVREVVELGEGRKALLAVHAVTDAAGRRYDGRAGLAPSLEIGDRALAENVYEPEEPVLRKGKSLSEEEKEDRALRDRTRFDPYLRRAADVLLGLQAIGHEWR